MDGKLKCAHEKAFGELFIKAILLFRYHDFNNRRRESRHACMI